MDNPIVLGLCQCGHSLDAHNDKYGGCSGHCQCGVCPTDTENDCWCAGFKPIGVPG
jgi:hypothetical protein